MRALGRPMSQLWKHSMEDRVPYEAGEMYCPTCCGDRRMRIFPLQIQGIASAVWCRNNEALLGTKPGSVEYGDTKDADPSVLVLQCIQCKTRFSAMIYGSAKGPALAMFPNTPGGLSTPNTPKNVKYYLEEAYKSHCAGATTATVVMYRAALEQLLIQQGYVKGKLADKIKALEADKETDKGPSWVRDIEPAYMTPIRKLGNEGVHLNSRDTDTLSVIDQSLSAEMHVVFVELLELVYEKEDRAKKRLEKLEAASRKAKGGRA